MSELTLTILSNVSSEAEVFNHLILVRREDTGEEGLLLCSHCCRWPGELIDKAKWLEGCYTPQAHKDDPRLLMGYHPRSVTSWSVKGKILTLTVLEPGASGLNGQVLNVDFYPPAPRIAFRESNYHERVDAEDLAAMFPQRRRFIQGLWEQAGQGRGYTEQVLTFFRMVDASRLSLWVKRMAVYHLEEEHQYRIETIANWTRNLPEHRYCEEYIDTLRVVVSDDATGYAIAQRVGLQPDIMLLQEAVVQYCVDTYGEFPILEFKIENNTYRWMASVGEVKVFLLVSASQLRNGDQFDIGRFADYNNGVDLTVNLDNGKVVLV